MTTKKPLGNLLFKESNFKSRCLTLGKDGFFYAIDQQMALKKLSTIGSSSNVEETGITWDKESYGAPIRILKTRKGLVVFTNKDNNGTKNALIYHQVDINSQPTLSVEPEDKTIETIWHEGFGIDYYDNGFKEYIVAGMYGSGQFSRDLVLSEDGGKTFKTIKKTVNIDTNGTFNSHWHDVCFDTFRGLLWATEGDGKNNRNTYYSENFGASWTLFNNQIQPTAIIPFPEKIIFGRDNKNVGIDSLVTGNEIKNLSKSLIKTEFEWRNQPADNHFAMKPVVWKENECYITFYLYGSGESQMVIGTGDFGESWHGLWVGDKFNLYNIVAVDDENIYCLSTENKGSVLYAQKPEWI